MCGWQVFLPAARPPVLPTAKLAPAPAPAALAAALQEAAFLSASNTVPAVYPRDKSVFHVHHGHLSTNVVQTGQYFPCPSGNPGHMDGLL